MANLTQVRNAKSPATGYDQNGTHASGAVPKSLHQVALLITVLIAAAFTALPQVAAHGGQQCECCSC